MITIKSKLLLYTLILNLFSARGQKHCPWELPDLKLWSDPATWDTGLVPEDGSSFDITQKILLDTETASLGKPDHNFGFSK